MRFVSAIDPALIADRPGYVGFICDILTSEHRKSVNIIGTCEFTDTLFADNIDYDLRALLVQMLLTSTAPPKAQYLKSIPPFMSNDKDLERRTKELLYLLHMERPTSPTIFISAVPRVNIDDEEVETSLNGKSESHLLLVSGKYSFDSFISTRQPRLTQLKHAPVAKTGPKGHVSPFSAYDKNNDTYARDLLQQAFDDYNGAEYEPKYLYTFDKRNKTFVQFRYNRNHEYHGMDIAKSQVPKEFKFLIDKYHQ